MKSYHIHFVPEVASTNTTLKELVASQHILAPYCVSAGSQTAGRGQRTKTWLSEPFANVLASFFVGEVGKVDDLARINNAAALAVVEALQAISVKDIRVKWPNDVYVKQKKIAGILIENTVAHGQVKNAIVGIGLNVNQTHFNGLAATSIRLETQLEYEVVEILHLIYDAFYHFINQENSILLLAINELLYKKNELVTFAYADRTEVYEVLAIQANGKLKVKRENKIMEIEHHLTKWLP